MVSILLVGLLSGAGLIVLTGIIYYFLSVRPIRGNLTDLEQHAQASTAATTAIPTVVTAHDLERQSTKLFPDLPTVVVDATPERK
jgi:hypothetical protein